MPLPTTATGPTNVYYVLDDSGTSGNSAGSATMISGEFVAPSGAAAIQAAYIICTAQQRNGRVVNKYAGTPPYTLINAGAANIALTSVPSGVNSP